MELFSIGRKQFSIFLKIFYFNERFLKRENQFLCLNSNLIILILNNLILFSNF